MAVKKPRVSVVILNWNGKSFLERFLPVLEANTPAWVTLIVADNASADGSPAYLRENHPNIQVVELPENLGYAGGYNASLKLLDADYFVLLNSDIEVAPGWVEPVIQLMEKDPEIAACQPKILSYHDRQQFEYAGASGGFLDRYGYPFCRGRLFNTLEEDTGQYDDIRVVLWATGACLFVRAAAFRAVGGFDDRFFAHMEEVDLCWRFHHAGLKVMVHPGATVYHIGGGSLPKSSARKTFLNFRNSLWMLAKNLPAKAFYPTIFIRIMLDIIASLSFLIKGQTSVCLAVFRAYIAFFGKFRSMRKHSASVPRELPAMLYKRSIVADYFVRGKRKFSELGIRH